MPPEPRVRAAGPCSGRPEGRGGPTHLALLAHPVGHSLSPRMHASALAEAGLDGTYLPCDVLPGDLRAAVHGLVALGFAGANVSLPHKSAVLELADEITPPARAAGAANTLVFRGPPGERRIVAHNTDGPGFVAAWEARFGVGSLRGERLLLLGSGGAARGVAVAAAGAGIRSLAILARLPSRGDRMLDDLRPFLGEEVAIGPTRPLEDALFARALHEADAVVQATSVGMHPHAASTPVAWPEGIGPGMRVMDLVYSPRPTRFLLEAGAAGAEGEDGLAMLVEQGALAFELFTGVVPSRETMRRAIAGP